MAIKMAPGICEINKVNASCLEAACNCCCKLVTLIFSTSQEAYTWLECVFYYSEKRCISKEEVEENLYFISLYGQPVIGWPKTGNGRLWRAGTNFLLTKASVPLKDRNGRANLRSTPLITLLELVKFFRWCVHPAHGLSRKVLVSVWQTVPWASLLHCTKISKIFFGHREVLRFAFLLSVKQSYILCIIMPKKVPKINK